MTFQDLLVMGINNLLRRKMRTALTVLGVVVGTAAVVVMVSLGIGLNDLTLKQISSWGSLTTIEVYPNADSSNQSGNSSSKAKANYITDDTIQQFSRIEHIESVSPVLEISVLLRQGVYEASYVTLQGVNQYCLSQLKAGEGRIPKKGELELFVGNAVAQQFANARTGKGYWDTGEIPDIDFMNKPLFVIFDIDTYYQSKNTSASESGSGGSMGMSSGNGNTTAVKPPKKYAIPSCGLMAGGPTDYSNDSYNVYTDLEALQTQLRKVFKRGTVIPGQPTNKKGKPYKYFIYNSAKIFVDDMDHVQEVQEQLANMGFQVSSQLEWLESSKQQSGMVQAVLGGIGAVSLFVAAIGIANTMMMSIYERTKDIGIMKVLGYDMSSIRNMFLIESGCIGFMGGTSGIILSYIASVLINNLVNIEGLYGVDGKISQIPVWLTMAAVVFAVLVGMGAGFMPATRAMKLSPLAAMRND